jgi:SAM-dependent methyltransferase
MRPNIITSIFGRVATTFLPTRRTCPHCSWSGRQFDRGGARNKLRFDSKCPRCGAMERHRLAYLVATTKADLDYSAVLHVAPEPQMEAFLRSRATDYLSVDLYATNVMAKMDVTALDLENESKTLVWMSHVLEHVRRDDLAISEMRRVLKPGGVALIQVPIWRLKTFEDDSVTTEEDRLRIFYQKDHVRLYGLDIIERFEAAGFEATVIRAQDFGSDLLIEHRLSFASTDEVFIFRKP